MKQKLELSVDADNLMCYFAEVFIMGHTSNRKFTSHSSHYKDLKPDNVVTLLTLYSSKVLWLSMI